MLVLIEGGEAVGKTTLAGRVQAAFFGLPGPGRRVLTHYGPPERHPLEDYELDLDWYRPGAGDHLVLDRGHLSELVYGPRYRGASDLGPAGELHVEAYLASRGAVVVYLHDSARAVRGRLEATRDESDGYATSNSDAEALNVDFAGVVARCRLPVLGYRFGEADLDEVLREAAGAELAAEPLAPYPSYVGVAYPAVLLLGAERPKGRRASAHAACFAPYPDCSGKYLFSLLGALMPDFRATCGVANALEVGAGLPGLVEALGRPAVVALGKEAHGELERAGVAHGTAPHPQYHRRFHSYRPRLYAAALRDAAAGTHTFSYPIPPAGEGWESDVHLYDEEA